MWSLLLLSATARPVSGRLSAVPHHLVGLHDGRLVVVDAVESACVFSILGPIEPQQELVRFEQGCRDPGAGVSDGRLFAWNGQEVVRLEGGHTKRWTAPGHLLDAHVVNGAFQALVRQDDLDFGSLLTTWGEGPPTSTQTDHPLQSFVKGPGGSNLAWGLIEGGTTKSMHELYRIDGGETRLLRGISRPIHNSTYAADESGMVGISCFSPGRFGWHCSGPYWMPVTGEEVVRVGGFESDFEAYRMVGIEDLAVAYTRTDGTLNEIRLTPFEAVDTSKCLTKIRKNHQLVAAGAWLVVVRDEDKLSWFEISKDRMKALPTRCRGARL